MIAPSDLQRAAIRAMQDAARALNEQGTTHDMADHMATFTERDALIGLAQYKAWESSYAG